MKLVLCEGKDEVSLIGGLCQASGLSGIAVETFEGKNKLRQVLAELPKRPEFARKEVTSLGLLLDAGEDPAANWQMLRNDVSATFGCNLVNQTEFIGENPKIGGLLIGGKDGRGMLEDLCLEAVRDKPGYDCLTDYFRCLAEKTGCASFYPVNPVHPVKSPRSAWAALAASGALPESVNYTRKSSFLLGFLESVPEVSAKLKEPQTKERKFEDVVKEAEQAAVLVLVY